MADSHWLQHLLAEHLHLLLGEICFCQYVLNLDEPTTQLLVLLPLMLSDSKLTAQSKERELRPRMAWIDTEGG